MTREKEKLVKKPSPMRNTAWGFFTLDKIYVFAIIGLVAVF